MTAAPLPDGYREDVRKRAMQAETLDEQLAIIGEYALALMTAPLIAYRKEPENGQA